MGDEPVRAAAPGSRSTYPCWKDNVEFVENHHRIGRVSQQLTGLRPGLLPHIYIALTIPCFQVPSPIRRNVAVAE